MVRSPKLFPEFIEETGEFKVRKGRIENMENMGITKETINENIREPEKLEELYFSNKKKFSEIIREIYSEDADIIIKYWYTRLFYKPNSKSGEKVNRFRCLLTAVLIIAAWIPLRLAMSFIGENYGYLEKLIPAVFSFAFSFLYLCNPLKIKSILFSFLLNGGLYVYFILLPDNGSQSSNNAFYFQFVLLWFILLLARSRFQIKALDCAGFIETTGEVIVWSILFLLGGGIIVFLSLSLFDTINISANEFYFKNVATLGFIATPFISLLVTERFNKIKLSVIIADIFLSLILLSIAAFGTASLFTNSKPYEDRDIFILYNIMMVIVLCVLVFTSISDINNKLINICSYILPVITIVLDIITISAVIYRLANYGITANKITLLGTNIAMLGHLFYIFILKLKQTVSKNVKYLLVYAVWAGVVVFVFPFIFKTE